MMDTHIETEALGKLRERVTMEQIQIKNITLCCDHDHDIIREGNTMHSLASIIHWSELIAVRPIKHTKFRLLSMKYWFHMILFNKIIQYYLLQTHTHHIVKDSIEL